MAKLWQKSYRIDELLEEFTVGRDHILDLELGAADCAGSLAHARMLNRQGLLSDEDLGLLEPALREIARAFLHREIEIARSDEDCHTAIENRLIEKTGDAGKRIHLGRSRNDQVMTMLRLYGREYLLEIRHSLLDLIGSLEAFARHNEKVPMPGRTHMQIAMPSTVGLWAAGYAEDLMDSYQLLLTAFELFDRSPLGTAAGYGAPLHIDREYSAAQMGFPHIQNNILSVQNSRGKLEAAIASAIDQVLMCTSKMAQDLILFSLPEFGYFSLPDELCTGSSIMPQKKNPDGLELLRSRAASVGGWSAQIAGMLRSLPSGYNRDFQDSKEPFLRVLHTALPAIRIARLTIEKLSVNEDALRAAHRPEIFATDEAIRLVAGGMSFRDAYRQVGENLDKLEGYDVDDVLESRSSSGYPANLNLALLVTRIRDFREHLETDTRRHSDAISGLLDGITSLIPGL
jgi:argininosuccinate lyase